MISYADTFEDALDCVMKEYKFIDDYVIMYNFELMVCRVNFQVNNRLHMLQMVHKIVFDVDTVESLHKNICNLLNGCKQVFKL